jgi:hypothetical protein
MIMPVNAINIICFTTAVFWTLIRGLAQNPDLEISRLPPHSKLWRKLRIARA